jgi:hypothetical protein
VGPLAAQFFKSGDLGDFPSFPHFEPIRPTNQPQMSAPVQNYKLDGLRLMSATEMKACIDQRTQAAQQPSQATQWKWKDLLDMFAAAQASAMREGALKWSVEVVDSEMTLEMVQKVHKLSKELGFDVFATIQFSPKCCKHVRTFYFTPVE